MALLVCFVGIMNSMLMSVTERFKEIGTMKCLGALDRFIVTLFFIEAGLMGLIASAAGLVSGLVYHRIRACVFQRTERVRTARSGYGTLIQMLQSMGIGLGITLVAAIPPAIQRRQNAARCRAAQYDIGK